MPMSWDRGSQVTITSVLVSAPVAVSQADGVRQQVRIGDLHRLGGAGGT